MPRHTASKRWSQTPTPGPLPTPMLSLIRASTLVKSPDSPPAARWLLQGAASTHSFTPHSGGVGQPLRCTRRVLGAQEPTGRRTVEVGRTGSEEAVTGWSEPPRREAQDGDGTHGRPHVRAPAAQGLQKPSWRKVTPSQAIPCPRGQAMESLSHLSQAEDLDLQTPLLTRPISTYPLPTNPLVTAHRSLTIIFLFLKYASCPPTLTPIATPAGIASVFFFVCLFVNIFY